MAPSFVKAANLPQGHFPWTASPNFTLCDSCADHFGRCAWCGGSLTGSNFSMLPTTKRFCQTFDQDAGKHVEGMYVGEQILVKLTVDLYSGVSWRVKQLTRGVRLANSRLITEGGQYGWLEMYFDLNEVDSKAGILLEQEASRSWVSLKNPKIWGITVEVKH
jgi:hypothetical protein